MRISRRTSGGRGEYEISEVARSGLGPADLQGRRLFLDLGNGIVFDTATTLRIQGGKPRLRMMEGCEIHLHLQLAAALLMPHPVREDSALGSGAPVLQRNRYAIEHINLEDALQADAEAIRLKVSDVVLQNRTYAAEEFQGPSRLAQVLRVWEKAAAFPERIRDLLIAHHSLVAAGGPLLAEAERIVYELQSEVSESSADLGVSYGPDSDVLPALVQFLDSIVPEPPVKVDEIEPEEVEIRRRTVRQWRQWASCRGAESARFRRRVRDAYNSACVVCGLRLPATEFNRNPGVDAAHILPWSEYDLDEVSNGICACKLHHWAFDEGLIRIAFRDGKYFLEIPDEVRDRIERSGFTLAELRGHVGEISTERLPRKASERPRPQFLKILEEAME
jgi:putative restriction endonuclease